MATIVGRKVAADLYLNLLVPWERVYKGLPSVGSFHIKGKEFVAYKRSEGMEVMTFGSKAESDKEIVQNVSFGLDSKQLIIFQKGDSSRARSLFKHLRNSIAHARIERIKIKNKWFLVFSAINDGKYVLKAQIQESKIPGFIAAVKSTAKSISL